MIACYLIHLFNVIVDVVEGAEVSVHSADRILQALDRNICKLFQ
jgi:hypothetical protein